MLKKVWNWLQLYLSLQDAILWGKTLSPFIVAGGLAVVGYLENVPLIYIGLAACVGFAMVAHGVNALSDWHKRNALLYKFRLTDIGFRWDTDSGKRDGVVTLLQPVFSFDNLGDRPLSIKVVKFDWRIENRVPTDPWPVNLYRSEPLSSNYFWGLRAEVSGLDFSETKAGTVSIDLFYGPPGGERHHWSRSWTVYITRTPDPDTGELRLSWNFAEPTVPQSGAQQALTLPA